MTDQPQQPTARVVRCPRCRKSVRYDLKNPYRPFCSAVCKNEDIVSWAEEGYRIAGEPVPGEALPPEPRQHEDD